MPTSLLFRSLKLPSRNTSIGKPLEKNKGIPTDFPGDACISQLLFPPHLCIVLKNNQKQQSNE